LLEYNPINPADPVLSVILKPFKCCNSWDHYWL